MARRPKRASGGWAAFTDGGLAPSWVVAARVVMLLAFAATIPLVLGVEHGNRLVWTVLIAALPFFWMTAGYHVWRRICPLAVMGQLGRLVGRPGTRKMSDWMARHYLYVQLALMIACLALRLVATNGSAVWLAGFLGVVILAAVVTSFVYGGKTWCNFVCPVGLVEKIHTEPSRSATGRPSELTSQCAPCVACKKHCPDIDVEQGYWKEAGEPARRVAYFAWPGIVVGFYVYYYLVAGNWSSYFSGAWAYQRDLPSHAFDAGFTFAPIVPRIVAAPLTLLVFGAVSFAVFASVEHLMRWQRQRSELAPEATREQRDVIAVRVRHAMMAFAGLVAFNAFYCFAGQPSLQKLPSWVVTGWGVLVVFSSTAMFMRRLGRREDQYVQEKFAQKILKKWEWGDAPPSDDLKDIYLLHTERTKQREARLRAYKETVREMVTDGLVTRNELVLLDSLRAQLGVSDKDHHKIIGELSAEERQLFDPAYQGSVEQRLAQQQYRKDLERIVIEAARQGTAPATLAQLRAERGVSEDEEREALDALLAPGGPIAAIYEGELARIAQLAEAAEVANAPSVGTSESASLALVEHLCLRQAHEHVAHALGVLAVMTKRDDVEPVRHLAKHRGVLRAHQLEPLARQEPALVQPLLELVGRLEHNEAKPLSLAPILAVLPHATRHLRAAGAVLLTRFESEDARSALLAMIDDHDAIVREAAVRAMGVKHRLTREVLARVLDDPDPSVRHAAVRAISGGTQSSPSLPALAEMARLAQTTKGAALAGVYATLDANAAMSSLTTIEKMMLIRQVPIFSELDAEDLEELASIVEERMIDAGEELFREGDVGDAVYLIVKGKLRVFVGGERVDGGRPETTISEAGVGACIGEMAVLDSSPRSASVRALERTRTLRVPGEGFKRLLSDRPEMSEAIVGELVVRMRGLMARG